MAKSLHEEAYYVEKLVLGLLGKLPEDEQRDFEVLFDLVYEGNRYMERTTKAIRKKKVSLSGFTESDKEVFSSLLGILKLDGELRRRFKDELENALRKPEN